MTDIDINSIIQVIDHLQKIITPLGVKVYTAYYIQTVYSGILEVITCGIFVLLSIFGLYKVYKHRTDEDKYNAWVFFYYEIIFVCVVIGFISLSMIPDAIMHIFNPDYYIIQQFMPSGY